MQPEHTLRGKSRWQIALAVAEDLTSTDVAVGWALSTWMDADGAGARPPVPAIARAAKVSRATAFRSLRRLEDLGYLRRDGGRGVASAFRPKIPAAVDNAVEKRLTRRTGETGGAGTRLTERRTRRTHETPPVSPVRHEPYRSLPRGADAAEQLGEILDVLAASSRAQLAGRLADPDADEVASGP